MSAHILTRARRRRPMPPWMKVMIAATLVMLAVLVFDVFLLITGQAKPITIFSLCFGVTFLLWSWPRLVAIWDWWRRSR